MSSELGETQGTKERLIQAAGPIFARSGFADATVREICEAAGANLAAINYHYGDKWGLYVATLEVAHDRLIETVPYPEWPEGISAEEKLARFVRATLLRMIDGEKTGWPGELLMREILGPSPACDVLIQRCFLPHFKSLLEIIRDLLGVDGGERQVSQVELELMAFAIIAQCFHYRMCGSFMKRISQSHCEPAETTSEQQEHELRGLIAHVTRFSLAAIKNWFPSANDSEIPSVAGDWPANSDWYKADRSAEE